MRIKMSLLLVEELQNWDDKYYLSEENSISKITPLS